MQENQWQLNLPRIILTESSKCPKCNREMFEGSMKGFNEQQKTPMYDEEILEHDCGFKFVARYNLFAEDGHITPSTFSEDCNDLEMKWHNRLDEKQKELVMLHLEKCTHCQEKRDQMVLEETELAITLEEIRKRTGVKVKPRDFRKPGDK